jgi:hypothetical protein
MNVNKSKTEIKDQSQLWINQDQVQNQDLMKKNQADMSLSKLY